MIQIATRTLAAIEDTIFNDQGAAFREAQGRIIPHMKDAYRGKDEDNGFRNHLGASVIGKECARHIWYGFRWVRKPLFGARMLRLFNRGHLEEARFLAMLLSIGCKVYQQDANGNQFRISELGGHLGGSGDGVIVGLPDLLPGTPCLAEFKTHGEKSFIKLEKEGVRVAKFEHYVQMQVYMRKMNLSYALYGAVNKNTDALYMEIILLDPDFADQFLDRGRQIIMMKVAPAKIHNASPGLFTCRYCDHIDICHKGAPMDRNCRTCMYSEAREDGKWICNSVERLLVTQDTILTKEIQLVGCKSHTPI